MRTDEALARFLKRGEERGLSPETRRTYYSRLHHFAEEHPELPLDTPTIEKFLQARHETPKHRGTIFRVLQAFYSDLEQNEGIKSPVPSSGQVGRPPKLKPFYTQPLMPEGVTAPVKASKLVQGGGSASNYTSISTAQAVDAFLNSRRALRVSDRTLHNYQDFFRPFIATCPVLPVTYEPIEAFLAARKGTQLTVWTYRRCLRSLYLFLEERRWIPETLVRFPRMKQERVAHAFLDHEQLVRLYAFGRSFLEKTILSLLIDSKIRAGELVDLNAEDVHPDYIEVKGKTGTRLCPIQQDTHARLCQLASSGALFTVNGHRMRREYLYRLIRSIIERAGLESRKMGPHLLRHSASVDHITQGGDLASLQAELGHTTPVMTAQYAALAAPQVKLVHQKVNVMGRIAGEASKGAVNGAEEVPVEVPELNESEVKP